MRSRVARGSLLERSSVRRRVYPRNAAGDSARTPMNFETGPPPVWMLLINWALPSGAVSSSWMWKRLTSVFTVILSLTAFHTGFTLLLAGYLRLVSVPSLGAFCFLIRRTGRVGCYLRGRAAGPPGRRGQSRTGSAHGCLDRDQGRHRDQPEGGDRVLRGERRPLRPALVHRPARAAEELLDPCRRAR